jgi:hypothetical protein
MRKLLLAAAGIAATLALTQAPARADLKDATYHFSGSTTGNTTIAATAGTYTDPANPGFCVGPSLGCAIGFGLSGSFAFTDLTPTSSTITFTFFGSTAGAAPGTFVIDLGNFVTTDGDKITNVTYASGNLAGGDFNQVSWNGTDAVFTGSNPDFTALGGDTVVFDVTETAAAVPEASTWAMMLIGFASLGFAAYRAKRNRLDAAFE